MPRVKESDLSGHLNNTNGGNGESNPETARKLSSELLAADNQLYEALTLLKGLNILGMRERKAQGTSDKQPSGES
jgi:carboxyl-terminal processing protease